MPGHGINIPPVYFAVALAVMALLDYAVPVLPVFVAPYRYAGLVIAVLGLALAGWGAFLFWRARTGIVPFSPATALVTRGPYRVTRNPMYLGMAAMLLGAAVYLGSLTPFIVLPAFTALIAERFIAPEEAMLERAFGAAYLEYKARVRRWL